MMNKENLRYKRQIALFGTKGQKLIAKTTVAILGLGGLGTHYAQQLAYLGVKNFILIDGDKVEDHNLNRLIGGNEKDIGKYKTIIASRLIKNINNAISPIEISEYIQKIDLTKSLKKANLIMGGFDNDYPRLLTLNVASDLKIPYIDAATGVEEDSQLPTAYGGRIVISGLSRGCLFCLNEIDQREVRLAQMSPSELKNEAKIYGINVKDLLSSGPSVVTINGVVASLAVTEAMMLMTRLRDVYKYQNYRGDLGSVLQLKKKPAISCPYCHKWGFKQAVDSKTP